MDLPSAASRQASAHRFRSPTAARTSSFPGERADAIYFTQGTCQQDMTRLPLAGMFPRYENPQKYFDLAETPDEPRTRWFAYRCALARTEPHDLLHAQALLRIGQPAPRAWRPDLARLASATAGEDARTRARSRRDGAGEPRSNGGAFAGVDADLASAALEGVRGRADLPSGMRRRRGWCAHRAGARRGDGRTRRATAAIDAFDHVVRAAEDQPFSAARAMLRRIELLGIAHDPDALGEAYARVLRRYPEQREVVREASERIVEVHLNELRRTELPRAGGRAAPIDPALRPLAGEPGGARAAHRDPAPPQRRSRRGAGAVALGGRGEGSRRSTAGRPRAGAAGACAGEAGSARRCQQCLGSSAPRVRRATGRHLDGARRHHAREPEARRAGGSETEGAGGAGCVPQRHRQRSDAGGSTPPLPGALGRGR